MNNILYVANIRMPTDRAHGLQVIRMCRALAESGNSVTLLVPRKKNYLKQNPFVYYDIEPTFVIKYVWFPSLFQFTKFGRLIQWLVLSIAICWEYYTNQKYDFVYVKDDKLVYFLSFFTNKLIWEPHVGDVDFIARRVMQKAQAIVPLTCGVRRDLCARGGEPSKMIVAHDAVQLEDYINLPTKEAVRAKLGWSHDKKIVVYTGHLFEWKGVHVLADAARMCDDGVQVVFVGGLPADVEKLREYTKDIDSITILGHRAPKEIPEYLVAADVLVLPNSGLLTISKHYTSPLKLFEYMAAKRPIIASDLPSLREVLNEKNAILVEPDNPHALAKAINAVDLSSRETHERVRGAYEDVVKNTWYNRAQRIMGFKEEIWKE